MKHFLAFVSMQAENVDARSFIEENFLGLVFTISRLSSFSVLSHLFSKEIAEKSLSWKMVSSGIECCLRVVFVEV